MDLVHCLKQYLMPYREKRLYLVVSNESVPHSKIKRDGVPSPEMRSEVQRETAQR